MNAARKWICIGCVCVLGLVIIIPPWHQTYKGKPLIYHEEMGHHLLWSPPPPTGEQSWVVSAPASECRVTIKWNELFWQCGNLVAIGAILWFAFRKSPLAITNRSL